MGMGISWENKMEVKSIYKITNKVNGKSYIGVSNNPERRFHEHCNQGYKYTSLIHRAIKKWGEHNFIFEVLEETHDWEAKEVAYIAQLRTQAPNGYNIHPGGGAPPVHYGADNFNTKITEETARAIQRELLDHKIHRKTIWKKHNVTMDIIRHINDGHSWRDESLSYPLRPAEKELNYQRMLEVVDMLENTTLTQKEIGRRVGWCRTAITAINQGQNYKDPNRIYPIRK